VHFIKKSLVGKTLSVVKTQEDANVYGKVGTSASEFQKALTGKKVLDAGQQGKYFWMIMSEPPHPVMHFGMNGKSCSSYSACRGNSLIMTCRVVSYQRRTNSKVRLQVQGLLRLAAEILEVCCRNGGRAESRSCFHRFKTFRQDKIS